MTVESMGERQRVGGAEEAETAAPRRRRWTRALPLLALFAAGVTLWFLLDLGRFAELEALRENRERLAALVEDNALLAGLGFVAVYALATAFSLPLGSLMTLVAGFLFGTLLATAYVVVGATLGATAVFLAARSALGDLLRARAGGSLDRMREGFRENALSYLLVLRLVPLFPFWLVNLVPAFLGVPLRTYVVATAVGIIPGSFVYASAGNGLGAVLAAGDSPNLGLIFDPAVLTPILGLALLSLLPVGYRRWKARKTGARGER